MKFVIFTISLLFFSLIGFNQSLNGLWKGSIYPNRTSPDKGMVIYLELTADKSGTISGKSRNELYNTNDFAIKNVKGKSESNNIQLSETVIAKKAVASRTMWCRLEYQLVYNNETGYLEGTYSSNDCKNQLGKVILYRENSSFPDEIVNQESHHWFDLLAKDLLKGLNAPEIRKKERENFVFMPIYFDYDKAEIKTEYYDFLNRMIHVVEGHSDLRVKVTGHTDSDGSDAYNDDLSKKRAQAIINYFVSKGLEADRLEFDFKGEHAPIETNKTSEGRQKNRRVEFSFI
ncbi:MAG: OmpA family protein [Crocinitomicaceae bacterium]|nr:OmpA family protein [Crocinitomicaceae bacterium]